MDMAKCALLVAFHFPPFKSSSGLERALSLVRHLPAGGWEPAILSASPAAYPATSDERMREVPESVPVVRAFARDASRHFALRGRYPAWFALPDRWQSWVIGAVPAGLMMIRSYRPDVLWTTYPLATAHVIGYVLHRISGLPWIADFRDPMVEFDDRSGRWYPTWTVLRSVRLAIERVVARHATAVTFCTPGARRIFAARYPQVRPEQLHVIGNGFDESAFAAAAVWPAASQAEELVLLHSGTIYPSPDRDPTFFFRALRRLVQERGPQARRLRVVLRASGAEAYLRSKIDTADLAGIVELAPAIAYSEALAEMMHVHGLLLFQGYTSNPAIPAKLYEYFRAGRPILALTDDAGDTAALVRAESAGIVAPLDDEEVGLHALRAFIDGIESGQLEAMPRERVALYERSRAVEAFARLFDAVADASRRR